MAGRRLDAEESALWARVIASVRPIEPRPARPRPIESPPLEPGAVAAPALPAKPAPAPSRPVKPGRVAPPRPAARPAPAAPAIGETLDGGWDRRLRQGQVAPDLVVDLHGYTLASAHDVLDHGLQRAIAAGARLLLLVTGKPRPAPRGGEPVRGVIRAAVGDWLAASRHAAAIAAVRQAHPRHGGSGALYIIIRRPKIRPRKD